MRTSAGDPPISLGMMKFGNGDAGSGSGCEWSELADRARLGLGGLAGDEIVGTGFGVEVTASDHVPGGDEHCVFHGDQRLHRAPADRDPVVLAEIGCPSSEHGQRQSRGRSRDTGYQAGTSTTSPVP